MGLSTDVIRFLTEFVVPLGNRGMERAAASLAKRCGHCLIGRHADAMTLRRAMERFELAGCTTAAHDVAVLLNHWRVADTRQRRARRLLGTALLLMLGGAGVLGVFTVITTADDVVRSKPDPLPYARTSELLGVAAAECVAVEDTVGGLTSAKGAGCRAVAVGHTQARERLGIADRYVERVGELTVEQLLAM